MAKKGKGKKSGKKDKGGKGTRTPVMVDGVAAEEMSQEQLVEHVGRMREEVSVSNFLREILIIKPFLFVSNDNRIFSVRP